MPSISNASKKEDFLMKNFQNVNNDDTVLADFSCSLQRDALVQGRIYLTYYGFYFHSRILGFVTTAFGFWREVTELRKDKAAYVLPIIVHIHTPSEKFTFHLLQNRNRAFEIAKISWINASAENQLSKDGLIEKVEDLLKFDENELSEEMRSSCPDNVAKPVTLLPISSSDDGIQNTNDSGMVTPQSSSKMSVLSEDAKSSDPARNSIPSLSALPLATQTPEDFDLICNCQKNDFALITSQKLSCDLETVKFLLFDDKSPIIPLLVAKLSLQNFKITKNECDEKVEGEFRTVSYVYPLGFPFSPVLTETIQEFKPPGLWNHDHCSVYSTSTSPNTIYSDHFRALIRYCFTREQNIITIKVYFKIDYIKRVTPMIKSIINSKSATKTEEYITTQLNLLADHLLQVDRSEQESFFDPLLSHVGVSTIPGVAQNESSKDNLSTVILAIFWSNIKCLLLESSKTFTFMLIITLLLYVQVRLLTTISYLLENNRFLVESITRLVDGVMRDFNNTERFCTHAKPF